VSGIAAVTAFTLAFIMQIGSFSLGRLTWQGVAVLGLLFLTVHLVAPPWPRRA